MIPMLLAAANAAEPVSWYDTRLPSTLNPLYSADMADVRAQELVFDKLFYRSAIT